MTVSNNACKKQIRNLWMRIYLNMVLVINLHRCLICIFICLIINCELMLIYFNLIFFHKIYNMKEIKCLFLHINLIFSEVYMIWIFPEFKRTHIIFYLNSLTKLVKWHKYRHQACILHNNCTYKTLHRGFSIYQTPLWERIWESFYNNNFYNSDNHCVNTV